jgi:hypothetical protein
MEQLGLFSTRVVQGEHIKHTSVETLELQASRRALALLKNKLGSARMLELVRQEIERTDRLWEAWAEESNGEWAFNFIEYEVKGLSATYYLTWLRDHLSEESMHFAVHPEHYAWIRASQVDDGFPKGEWMVVEPMGDHLLRGYASLEDWPGAEDYFDGDYPIRMQLVGWTRRGVAIHRSLAQYRDTADGFACKFHSFKPVKIMSEALKIGGMQHAYLEYHHYMKRAYEALQQGG